MKRLDFIRRQPGIWDYNLLVETVNKLIDKLEERIDVEPIVINREIKDYWFFNNEETHLPYEAHYTISNSEEASKVFNKYVLSFDEMKSINKALEKNKIVSLNIFVKELVTEKEEKQEVLFEKVETIPADELNVKHKRGRPKKKQTKWKIK